MQRQQGGNKEMIDVCETRKQVMHSNVLCLFVSLCGLRRKVAEVEHEVGRKIS
jgi:hypothetical protein